MSDVREIFGFPIAASTMDEVVELCDEAVADHQPTQIGVLNAAKVVNSQSDGRLRQAVLSCDVILADGQAVVWASKLLQRPLPERVAGVDLFERLLQLADRRHYSVFLLGAQPAVVEKVAEVVTARYPGLRLAGYHHGYYTDEQAVAEEISNARPDMLFLGMTSPKKEIFLENHQAVLKVPVMHGVGGSFDILAGVTKRAPRHWQALGMEWAYRLVQEPQRLGGRYLRTNALFTFMTIQAVIKQRMRRAARPVHGTES